MSKTESWTEKAKDIADKAGDKAKDAAHTAADKAQGWVETARDKASDVAGAAKDKADSATQSVGRGMETAADKVRQYAPSGRVTESVAGAIERGGEYLEEKGLSGVADDLVELVRKNPIPALLIGFGVGFLVARALRS
jgi:vacuolar-type H+-ATPase subunit E/Vma4